MRGQHVGCCAGMCSLAQEAGVALYIACSSSNSSVACQVTSRQRKLACAEQALVLDLSMDASPLPDFVTMDDASTTILAKLQCEKLSL